MVGAYELSAPTSGKPEIHAIIFTREPAGSGHAFFSDIDMGSSYVRAEGWFTQERDTVSLHVTRIVSVPSSATASMSPASMPEANVDHGLFTGVYSYQQPSGGLTLARDGTTSRFQPVTTYCCFNADCERQNYDLSACSTREPGCGSNYRCGCAAGQ